MKQNKQTMNHKLSQAGLATLDDPRALLSQIAFGIKTHEQFRQLLAKVSPEDRVNCYQSLESRLCFVPKPLDTYIAEARNQADAEQLPTYDHETGKITEYGAVAPINLNALAEKAIREREKAERAKGTLELVCKKCTRNEFFPAKDKIQGLKDAERKGWRPDRENAYCPKCAKQRLIH